jgi:hypothetical protein
MICIRFNFGRLVAHFDTIDDLDNWVLNADLYQPFMYTVHGITQTNCLEKYKKYITNK